MRRRGAGILVVFAVAVAVTYPASAQNFTCNPPAVNQIVCENSKAGNPPSEWDISGAGDSTIQGFATDISVNQGQTVRFKIKTPASSYRIDIYRIGYYAGNGARKITTITPSAPLPQSQPACQTNSATGLVDCGKWKESASWAVPSNATSGVYIAKPVRTDTGGSSHIIFIVRSDASSSAVLFRTADSTWQAYNSYGGNSLYSGNPAGRAYKVSYNRPFNDRSGVVDGARNSWFFHAEYPMVRWLEANGYDVTYFTSVDTERYGSLIQRHKTMLSVGHDEYWSAGERASVENARGAGVNLAFFSGNEMFWKTRWENSIDGTNTPYRTLVCYKETVAGQPIDPLDPPTWTGTWRDPTFSPPGDGGRPENAVTGTLFMVNGTRNDSIAADSSFSPLRFWRNTAIASLSPGDVYEFPAGTLGYEWDSDVDNGFRPAGLFPLSSMTLDVTPKYLLDYGATYGSGIATHSLTMYRSSSGALVFGAGTVQWSWGLDSTHDSTGIPTDVNMQQATVNLLADMGAQPGTIQPGLIPASQSTDATPPNSAIVSPAPNASVSSGQFVNITGTAHDTGGVIAAVEVSTDSGATWHRATGKANWSYSWVPATIGSTSIRSRAVDDSGNLEAPSSGVPVTVTPDSDPPSISAVSAGPVSSTWALITWTTSNEPATSQVEYGTTTAYGSSTPLDTGMVTNHSVTVNGLAPGTLYHFRVKSRDAAGNAGVSGDFTFTTSSSSTTQAITFDDLSGSNVPLNGNYPSGIINWGSGNWFLSSAYGQFTTKSISFNGGSITTASFTFLSQFRLLQLDAYNGGRNSSTISISCPGQTTRQVVLPAGQLSTIPTNFTGSCSPVTISSSNGWDVNFDNLVVDSAPPAPPIISNVVASPTCSTAAVTWTTNQPSTSQIDYGTSPSYGDSTALDSAFVTSHSQNILNLTPGGLYHYRVRSTTSIGGSASSEDLTFSTAPAETTSPVISNLQVTAVTNSSAYITWNTDLTSDSMVSYGTTNSYGNAQTDGSLVTSHSMLLSGLSASTSYHFQVSSRFNCGPAALSSDLTFTTSSVAPVTIWPSTAVPVVVSQSDTSAVELGVRFTADTSGYIIGLRFYKGAANTGTHVGHLWSSTGTLLGTATFTNETGSGWQQVSFPAPILIAANTVYVASYHTDTGGYSLSQSYFASAGYDNPPLHALRDGINGTNGLYIYGASAFPTQSFSATNYWVDVVFAPIPPSISNVQASSTTGVNAIITWTTDQSSDSQVEYGTTAAYGNSTALNTTLVSNHSVGLTGLAGNTLYHYRVKSRNTAGQLAMSADFTFTTGTPPPPATISNVQAVAVSSSGATITWTTDVASDSAVDYGTTNAYGNSTPVDPAPVTTHSVVLSGLSPNTVYHYRVNSNNGAGALTSSGDYSFATTAAAASSLWSSSTVPSITSQNDSNAVELGLKFTADVNGYITAIRFYKGAANTGTHVGSLWTSTGTLLASATFTGETASGWQQVNFATPVAITAGTVYVASYHTNVGRYSLNSGYFATSGFDNAPLHAMPNSSGGNGVFSYGSGGFPTTSSNGSNYWVDVVLTSNPATISAVQASSITSSSAAITWSTDVISDSQVEYGTTTAYGSSTTLNSTPVANHSVALGGLASNTLCHYRVKSRNTAGMLTVSGDFTFTTGVPPQAVNITNVQAIAISNSSAYITWTTDIASDSKVDYGTTTAYGTSTPVNSTLVTSHSLMLSGLSANTPYHYRVTSRSATGGVGTSTDFTFSTTNTAPASIWSNATVPAIASHADTNAVELGLKFTAETNGYITAIRFYKGSANTGTHVGSLWTSTGTLLARATFTGETPSGWQQVDLASPVAITAGTVYVVSYHTNVGRYSVNSGYFATSGFDNAPLHASSSSSSGGNGVYVYGAGGFPNNTYNSTNYWVDVVFAR